MSAASAAVTKIILFNVSETTRASNYKNLTQHSPRPSLHSRWKGRHQLLPVGSKSHKRVHFRSCFGGDFSITLQPILKKFTVLETVIQLNNLFALCVEKRGLKWT